MGIPRRSSTVSIVVFVMSASSPSSPTRWNWPGFSLTERVLECEPSSERTRGMASGFGSRNSLFGTLRECELATYSWGSPVSRSTKTWSTSQSCQWKLAVNWSNAE